MLPLRPLPALAFLVGVLALALAGLAAPPKLESCIPDNADAVDAATFKEMVFRFDQPMSTTGQSVCGGGPSFPTFDGAPKWRDDRTFVVPVKLEPGHDYSFSINCPAARNFRSAAGEIAEIRPVSFRTLAPGEATPALSPDDAKKGAEAFETAFMGRYSYRTRLDIDWREEFKTLRPRLEAATSPAAFARAAAEMLAKARDPHVYVRVGSSTIPTFRRNVAPNFDSKRLAAALPNLTKRNDVVWTGSFPDGIGYILITTWPGGEPGKAQLGPALEALTTFAAAPGLIIDVRTNGGGDELAARRIAGRFVSQATQYSANDIADPAQRGGFTPRISRVLEPSPTSAGPRVTAPTAVLIGPACLSSNESFIAMMRPVRPKPGEPQTCVLVGETTGGSSGNPRPYDLGIGVTVVLPSWRDFQIDGTPIEGRGIAPDISVAWAPGEKDPVLDAALEWLRSRPK